MLVLGVEAGDEVVVSHAGEVVGRLKLIDIRSSKAVRLGFEFSREYVIDRAAVHESKRRAGKPQ